MTYKHFSTWIEGSQVLTGFNLTDRLLQQLFADLDPHKKGYLTILDWENSFSIIDFNKTNIVGGYNFHNQMYAEVQEAINANYSDAQSSFEFFLSHEGDTNQLKKRSQ